MKKMSDFPQLLRLLHEYSPLNEDYAQILLDIENRMSSQDMIVPFVGSQGMGKSTVINGLLGEDVLPSEADETTCVPVEIRYGEENGGTVFFKDGRKNLSVSTKQELSQYVDNQFNPGNEKQVDHISLIRQAPILKTGIVIVDLPGVGSLTKKNEETTNQYIRNLCAAVFIISTTPPILKSQANFISAAWRTFNTAYFVQNVWDSDTAEEAQEAIRHNTLVLKEISQKINAPILHSVIPVNAYAAAKGACDGDQTLVDQSNINELALVLEQFSGNYREESNASFSKRVQQIVQAATEQAERAVQEAGMSREELLVLLEKEQKEFADANEEVESQIRGIKLQLQKDRREVRRFSLEVAAKYTNLLRAEVFHLVDQGVVDGALLSDAFSEYQSQYATEAMDEVYEMFDDVWQRLKEKIDTLGEFLSRESLNSPTASSFNKVQAFKWEKGAEVALAVGGTLGGSFFAASIAGPWGIAAFVAASFLGSLLGRTAKKEVTKARGRQTKSELQPYLETFKSDMMDGINQSFEEFADQAESDMDKYVAERSRQLEAVQKHIRTIENDDQKIQQKIEELEADWNYLKNWSENFE